MCTYFNTKTDVVQNLSDDFFSNFDLSIRRILSEKNMGVWDECLKKADVLYAEINERAEAAPGSYSVTGYSLQYIYSVLVTKNHQKIQSRYLVHEFSLTYIF